MVAILISLMTAGVIWISMVFMPSWVTTAHAAEKTGKDVFLEYKCNGCHAVQTQGMSQDESLEGVDKEEDEGNGGEEVDPPDLSDTGLRHAAEFFKGFLKKKEKIEGRKHKKKFKGSKEELEALAGWLESLKTKPGTK